jgi:hypothetical protein
MGTLVSASAHGTEVSSDTEPGRAPMPLPRSFDEPDPVSNCTRNSVMKSILSALLLATFAVAATAGDTKAKSFKDLDADADGKLSAAEVASLSDLKRDFRAADSNTDGYLSEAEFQAWTGSHRPAQQPQGG